MRAWQAANINSIFVTYTNPNMAKAENKTIATKLSVEKFIAGIEGEERKQDCREIIRMMKKATGEEPVMWGTSVVGFGSYHYKYESGREGDMPVTGFSPRKQNLSLYLMSGMSKNPALLKKLGKHKTGKGCLYINRLSEVDKMVLEELIRKSVSLSCGA
jgi:hypothetical protein